MIYQSYRPAPALQAYVKEFLLLHFDFTGVSVRPMKSYTPHPEQCLTFNPRGRLTAINDQTCEIQRRNYSYLSGQQISCLHLHFDQDYLMLKIVFQPGVLFRLLGIPLVEFANQYVDAESVLNKEMRTVNEQLANAESYIKMIEVVEKYLLVKVNDLRIKSQPIDEIGKILRDQPSKFSLEWLAGQACLSPRQFERKFLERIGVSPRLFGRIARFNKAFELKEKNPGIDWLSVAITCGYVDFQHLNKDFKEFSGVTPTALLKKTANAVEKVLKLV